MGEDITANMDNNQNSFNEIHDFLDLSQFDLDEYNMEDFIVFMYKMALLYMSYGNYIIGKAPPLVRSNEENNYVIAYFQAKVQSKATQKYLNLWLTREEAIEVIYLLLHLYYLNENDTACNVMFRLFLSCIFILLSIAFIDVSSYLMKKMIYLYLFTCYYVLLFHQC
jgi:hypothetical protein